jgi:hypothetical protein
MHTRLPYIQQFGKAVGAKWLYTNIRNERRCDAFRFNQGSLRFLSFLARPGRGGLGGQTGEGHRGASLSPIPGNSSVSCPVSSWVNALARLGSLTVSLLPSPTFFLIRPRASSSAVRHPSPPAPAQCTLRGSPEPRPTVTATHQDPDVLWHPAPCRPGANQPAETRRDCPLPPCRVLRDVMQLMSCSLD